MHWTDNCAGEFYEALLRLTLDKFGKETAALLSDFIVNRQITSQRAPTFSDLRNAAQKEVSDWTAPVCADLEMAQYYLNILKALEEYVQ